ncbi:hypothetical protein HBH56_205520 [Parastagonospora nodorum]|nr:hypothetical protein HBH56_205520 [Parastagonospora nodorum]KAH3923817.1 hypothetical protein HBH54_204390 [Parastagonospora nodorum]KAH3962337.1 hypothetical protein HBH51_175820 [Parastagonospora nodorum]KAH3967240.1 hypothetical protein HBH52_192040 [Parastagonospora nodorum]KAH4059832.1 hypothetical protein HBH49_024680 [Parastagonospora nodorum]
MHPKCEITYSDSFEDIGMSDTGQRARLDEYIELIRFKKSLKRCYVAIITLLTLLTIALLYALYLSTRPRAVLLGADPFKFVPFYAGEPLQWTAIFDKKSPYYLDSTTFDDLETTKKAVRRLKVLHNSSDVLANDGFASYRSSDGQIYQLPAVPLVSEPLDGHRLYIIRGFLQMHCIIVLTEAFGYKVQNNTSQWPSEHVLHCINVLQEAVTCMADATPLSYAHEVGSSKANTSQQVLCRNYSALRAWANDPIRSIRYENISPEGSKTDSYRAVFPGQ